MNVTTTGNNSFLVAERLLDEEEDRVMLQPVYLVANAPEDTEVDDIKEIFEKTGTTHLFTTDGSTPVPERVWRQYKVLPLDAWEGFYWNPDTLNGSDFAESCLSYSREELLEKGEGEDVILYDNLVARISDEKRMTLRVPVGLHVALIRASNEMTLNAFCIKTLADAVGYSDLPEFEAQRAAQRRKPGRPKKVQESE